MPEFDCFYVLAMDAAGCCYEWAEFHVSAVDTVSEILESYGIVPIYLRVVA